MLPSETGASESSADRKGQRGRGCRPSGRSSGGEAWVQAPDAKVHRQVVAAGPLFSGALTPGMRLSTSRMVVRRFWRNPHGGSRHARQHVQYVVFTRIAQPVADHGQGIFFGAGAVSSVQLLFLSGFTCSRCRPAVVAGRSRRRNLRAGRALLAARQAGVNREGNSAVCGY